ncbi:MAG: HEAT repeat domain-containing protein [Chitinispirillaceae bacterium]|nr:HEAT repeat domain-containing protein [Chitinispirillaceae bacterium]
MADTLPPIVTNNPEMIVAGLSRYAVEGKLGNLQAVLAFLKNDDERVRTTATQAASAIIKENLISYYHDISEEVRTKLGQLLQSLDPRIIDEISKDLYGESNERRLRAIQVLGLLHKNPRIPEILGNLVKDRDEKIRATAVNLLGKFIGPDRQQLILALLNDPDKRVRANTVEALERVGNKRLVPILLRFRKDASNRIRGNILKALYNLGHKEIEQDLLEMLRQPSELMKASALWVISQITCCSRAIEDAAGLAFLSENEMVYRNAKNALTRLSTPRANGYLRYLDLFADLAPAPLPA